MFKRIKNFLIPIVVLIMLACSSEKKVDFITYEYEDEQIEIEKRITDIFESFINKEADKLDSFHLFGPKFTKFDDWEPLDRKDADQTRKSESEAIVAIDKFTYEIQDLKVDVFDKVAVSTFIIDYVAIAGEAELAAKARSTLVFVKDGEDWKITHEHFSSFKPNP
jgi:hypothetical protein